MTNVLKCFPKSKKCSNSAQKSILKLLKGAEYVKQCSKFEKTCPAQPGQAYLPYTISNNWLSLAVVNAEVQYISNSIKISCYYIKVSGIPSGNKFIKTIRYPHMWRYHFWPISLQYFRALSRTCGVPNRPPLSAEIFCFRFFASQSVSQS